MNEMVKKDGARPERYFSTREMETERRDSMKEKEEKVRQWFSLYFISTLNINYGQKYSL